MPRLRWLVAGLSLWRPRFALRLVPVGFEVDKVALGQVFLQVLWVSPVSIIPLWLYIFLYYLRDEGLLVAAVQRRSLTNNISTSPLRLHILIILFFFLCLYFLVCNLLYSPKAKAVPLHTTKALGGRGGVAPTHSRSRQ
jgi:hypothetical protein